MVGLPLNMDGTTSDMCARTTRFARQLEGRFMRPVRMIDERLTSFEAKSRRRESGKTVDARRKTVDAEAACLILADFWRTVPDSSDPPANC